MNWTHVKSCGGGAPPGAYLALAAPAARRHTCALAQVPLQTAFYCALCGALLAWRGVARAAWCGGRWNLKFFHILHVVNKREDEPQSLPSFFFLRQTWWWALKIRQSTIQYAGSLVPWDKLLVDQASDVSSTYNFFSQFLAKFVGKMKKKWKYEK